MAILIDESNLVATIRDSLRCQLEHKLGVLLTDRQADDIARNVAQAVHGLEIDDTHVIDTIDTRTLLSARDRHHDRCVSPFDDGHLTCPVVGGR